MLKSVYRSLNIWDTAFSKFDLENPKSRSWPWVRWIFKVTKWVRLPINSDPFHSLSIGYPIPGIHFFKFWPWKYKVKVITQGNIVGPTSYQLTSLLVHVNRSSHYWDTIISKFGLENALSTQLSWLMSEVKGRGHTISQASIQCI